MAAITRFITTQGPLQLCTVLAVLFDERSRNPHQEYEDYLIVHGSFVGDNTEVINQATMDLARVWKWKGVFCLDALEANLNKSPHLQQHDKIKLLQEFIGLPCPDEIYLVRNWQMTNELLLHSYRSAKKITYGDAIGQIDSYASPHYVQFDEIRTLQPFRCFSYSRESVIDPKSIPMRIARCDSFREVLESYLQVSETARSYCASLAPDAERSIVVIFKNASESRLTQLEKEIAIYVNAISAVASTGDKILLKPHPRETLHQSMIVKEIAERECGLKSEILGANSFLSLLPVEVFLIGNPMKCILSPLVTAASRQIKFLLDMEVQEGHSDEVLQVFSPERKRHYLSTQYLNDCILQRLSTWNGQTVIYEWDENDPVAVKLMQETDQSSAFWPRFSSPVQQEVISQIEFLNKAAATQDIDGVRKMTAELVRLAPQDLSLLLELGKIAERVGDLATANRAYEVATMFEPNCAAAHSALARTLKALAAERGQVAIAEACARHLAVS